MVQHDVYMMRRKHTQGHTQGRTQGPKDKALGHQCKNLHEKTRKLSNLSSVQNAAHNSSYPISFNESVDTCSLQNSSLIPTAILRKSCFFPQPSHTLHNPYLRLRTLIDSKLKYRVVDFYISPATHYFLTVDIQVEKTMSLGPLCLLSQLTKSDKDCDQAFDQHSTHLTLKTIDQDVLFRCETESPSFDFFNVQVICQSKNSLQIMTLEGLTECHWNRLSQVVTASKYWSSLMKIEHIFSESDDHGSVYQRLLISATTDYCTKQITMGIESLQAVQNLCLEDQLIVVKEGYFIVGFLLYINTFIREDNSFVLSSPVSRDLFALDIHLESHKTSYNNQVYDIHVKFLSEFPNFLTEDFIFMAIVSILCLFQDDSALSRNCNFQKERYLYEELLDRYINAKIASAQWNASSSNIWHNIDRVINFVKKVKPSYISFHRDQYIIQNRQ